MKREQDFDQTLKQWLNDGSDQAPERFVWAALEDVERTAQRGAWQASLEGTLMKLKPATRILSVAAMILLALVAYQVLGGSRFAGPTEPSSTPRLIVGADLSRILPPADLDIGTGSPYPAVSGDAALSVLLPEGIEGFPRTGFVDAKVTNHGFDGGYQAWSALFETAAEAQGGFDFLASKLDVKSTHGWRLEHSSVNSLGLGDESVLYYGTTYDLRNVGVYLWRVNNVVLAVFQWNYEGTQLRDVAEGMDARAH